MILSSSPLVRATIAADALGAGHGSGGSITGASFDAQRVAGLRVGRAW